MIYFIISAFRNQYVGPFSSDINTNEVYIVFYFGSSSLRSFLLILPKLRNILLPNANTAAR